MMLALVVFVRLQMGVGRMLQCRLSVPGDCVERLHGKALGRKQR